MTDDELREAERAAYEIVKTDWETCCGNGAASALEIQRMCVKVYTAGRESMRAEMMAERERSKNLIEDLSALKDMFLARQKLIHAEWEGSAKLLEALKSARSVLDSYNTASDWGPDDQRVLDQCSQTIAEYEASLG